MPVSTRNKLNSHISSLLTLISGATTSSLHHSMYPPAAHLSNAQGLVHSPRCPPRSQTQVGPPNDPMSTRDPDHISKEALHPIALDGDPLAMKHDVSNAPAQRTCPKSS